MVRELCPLKKRKLVRFQYIFQRSGLFPTFTVASGWNNRPSFPPLGNSSVFISRGKEFGHDVDIIFTTLELGMEENLLLAVIKSLEKQVGPKTFSAFVTVCPSGGEGDLL